MSDGGGEGSTRREKRVGGSAGRLWADVSMMQSLEEQLNSSGTIAAESRRAFQRGPESYTLPDNVKLDFRDQQLAADDDGGDGGKEARRKIDFFADGDDMAAVESFGVDAQSRKRRRGERSAAEAERHYGRKFRYAGGDRAGKGDDAPMGAESGPALHGQRRNLTGRAYEKRARLTGQHSRNSSRYGSTSTLASADGGDMTKEQRQARLRGLLAPHYSQDQLFNAEFPPDVGLAELGELMAKALGELSPEAIKESVESIDKEAALEIFGATKAAEAAGGLMTMNGSRRRTPGGVFLYLTKLWQAGEWRAGEPIPVPTLPVKKEEAVDKTETKPAGSADGEPPAAKS